MSAFSTTDRPDIGESNGLVDGLAYHREFRPTRKVCWTTPGLYITRLRLLSDPGLPFWDVSYCHGTIGDEQVQVELPFSQLPKSGFRGVIVQHARQDGIYARGIGALDNLSTLC